MSLGWLLFDLREGLRGRMRTLYLDCQMGCAGDMFSGALFDLLSEDEKVECLDYLESLGIPDVSFATKATSDCGVMGTSFKVIIKGDLQEGPGGEVLISPSLAMRKQRERLAQAGSEGSLARDPASGPSSQSFVVPDLAHAHHRRTPEEVADIIASLGLNNQVESDALAIFALLARAEARAHGVEVSEVHFHEVGAMDAIADVVAASVLMWLVNPAIVLASAINVGSGTVRCEHGELPVPAPAVSNLLRNAPIYSGSINGEVVRGELCTPTGAAILRHFVDEFSPMPKMRVVATGCGFGHRRFDAPNCLRAFVGDMSAQAPEVSFSECPNGPASHDAMQLEARDRARRDPQQGRFGGRAQAPETDMPGAYEKASDLLDQGSRGCDHRDAGNVRGVSHEPTQIVNKLHIGFDANPAIWGETLSRQPEMSDSIAELSCNIDDMSPEDLGFAFETLSDMPETLDVFMQPIQMKKSRPGTMLTALVRPEHVSIVARSIFELTTTIGIRKTMMSRMVLDRQVDVRDTPLGRLRVKVSEGYGVKREKPEYDDVARAFMQIRESE